MCCLCLFFFVVRQVPAFIVSRVRHQYQVECEYTSENRPPVGKPYCLLSHSRYLTCIKREYELLDWLLFGNTALNCRLLSNINNDFIFCFPSVIDTVGNSNGILHVKYSLQAFPLSDLTSSLVTSVNRPVQQNQECLL